MKTIESKAKEIFAFEKQISEHENEIKKIKTFKESVENELKDELISEGVNNTGFIKGVGMLSLSRSHYPSLNSGDLPGFIDSLRDTADFSIVVQTIPPKVLKNFLKRRVGETYKQFQDESFLDCIFPGSNYSAKEANEEFWKRQKVRVFSRVGLRWSKTANHI